MLSIDPNVTVESASTHPIISPVALFTPIFRAAAFVPPFFSLFNNLILAPSLMHSSIISFVFFLFFFFPPQREKKIKKKISGKIGLGKKQTIQQFLSSFNFQDLCILT